MEIQEGYSLLCDQVNEPKEVRLGGRLVIIPSPETYIATSISDGYDRKLFISLIKYFDNSAKWLTSKREVTQYINISGITDDTIGSINEILQTTGFKLERLKKDTNQEL